MSAGLPKRELIVGDADAHVVTGVEGAVEEQDGEPVAQVALQDAAEGAVSYTHLTLPTILLV